MGIERTDIPKHLTPGVRTEFENALQNAPTEWSKIATLITSTKGQEDYTWLGEALGSMNEWKDARVIQSLKEYSMTIKNRRFERTIQIDEDTLDDDQTGSLKPRIQGLAQTAEVFKDELVFSLLNNGFVSLAFDGQPFFSANHSWGGITYDNQMTGAASDLNLANLSTAKARIRSIKADNGITPLNIVPDTLVVHPENETNAKQILKSQFLISVDKSGTVDAQKGSANVLFQELPNLIVTPYVSPSTAWYVLATNRPVKPLILQQRRPVRFVARDNINSDIVFMYGKIMYGADWRGDAGYGLWHFAFGSTGA